MNTQSVLVIDDDPNVVALVTQALEDEGYAVLHAVDGEALAVARRAQPTLILLDMQMPGMDGVTVSRALRRDPRTAHIPIVVMTAQHAPEHMAVQAQADDLLPKPFDLTDLYTTVMAWTQH